MGIDFPSSPFFWGANVQRIAMALLEGLFPTLLASVLYNQKSLAASFTLETGSLQRLRREPCAQIV